GGAPRKHRPLLGDLVPRLMRLLITRPSRNHVRDQDNELHWVREATPAGSIDQVIVSYANLAAARGVHSAPVSVNARHEDPFWRNVAPYRTPPMEVTRQIDALRPLWLRGQILAVVLPYGLSSEAAWFLELVSRAVSRTEFGIPVIELYVSLDDRVDEDEFRR